VKEKHGIPGLVLGVSVNGKNEMLHSVGFSDIETLTEMRVDMSFRMASISKTFASVCTMLLYQQQKVDLDKPI
jgi:serine beta-lactamase-like protein LACTB